MHGDSEAVRRDRFVRLMEVLVGLVLLYGVEAWGGVEIADAGDQDFPLIGRLHLLVTLQYELNTYHASEVEGMRRCTESWLRVVRVVENRLFCVGSDAGAEFDGYRTWSIVWTCLGGLE